jgi:alpha-L-fucosidase
VLFREHLDHAEYAAGACAWSPGQVDARQWARLAKAAGMQYAVFTTRHHDGFCLWDSRLTDYTTVCQAAGRDFVRDYVDAFRAEGLRVGPYYSLADWRIPAYWAGPANDPAGWGRFRDYVHGQVRELLTGYGAIDLLWFDGAWPHSAELWRSRELVAMIRSLQPACLVNNRLGASVAGTHADGGLGAGESRQLGDFGTPEQHVSADPNRPWESCITSTWRLWGYAPNERWKSAEQILDTLIDATIKGGNLLLNVGPDGEGRLPQPFVDRLAAVGRWIDRHAAVIHGAERGEVCEFVTYGRQIRSGNTLYLVVRFWPTGGEIRVPGLASRVTRVRLLPGGAALPFTQVDGDLIIQGLPAESPEELFPVLAVECSEPPRAADWAKDRLWSGDATRMTAWAARRGDR